MDIEKVKKQREANRRSYQKHRDERLEQRAKEYAARREYYKKWRVKNRERLSANDRKRWPLRAEKQNARQKELRKNRPKEEQHRIDAESFLKKIFKRSVAWYDETLAKQDGHCALCPKVPLGMRHYVDHDHDCCKGRKSCGKCVRGLLCARCNMFVGFLEELLKAGDWIERAKLYLIFYKETQ